MEKYPGEKYRKLNTNLNYGLFTSDFASWDPVNNIYKKNSLGENLKLCNDTCDKITFVSERHSDCQRVCMDHIGEIIKEVPFTSCFKKYSYFDWLSLYDFIGGAKIPDLYFFDLVKKFDLEILRKCKDETCDSDGLCDNEFEKILKFTDTGLKSLKEKREANVFNVVENFEQTGKLSTCHLNIIISIIVIILFSILTLVICNKFGKVIKIESYKK
jgi:hypothetical protein